MSRGTVVTCAWCGLTAHADVVDDAEYLPKDWELFDGVELCTGCVISRLLALEKVKAERAGVNKGMGCRHDR